MEKRSSFKDIFWNGWEWGLAGWLGYGLELLKWEKIDLSLHFREWNVYLENQSCRKTDKSNEIYILLRKIQNIIGKDKISMENGEKWRKVFHSTKKWLKERAFFHFLIFLVSLSSFCFSFQVLNSPDNTHPLHQLERILNAPLHAFTSQRSLHSAFPPFIHKYRLSHFPFNDTHQRKEYSI